MLSLVALATSLTACAHGSYADSRCGWLRDRGAPPPTPAQRVALPPVNPDFASLRPFRSYVQVLDVGAYEEHFTVWYACIEPNVLEFTARRGNGHHVEVTRGHGAWGGLAVRDGEPARVPSEVRDLADAVLDEVRRHVPDARDLRIAYAGAYRPVHVHEVVPAGLPRDDTAARMASTAELTFAANRDLTSLERVVSYTGGITRLCWEDTNYVPCHGPARWLPVPVAAMDGSLLLPRFAEGLAHGHASAELASALLEGARDAEASRPMRTLASIHQAEDELLSTAGPSLLLPSMRQSIRAQLSIYARATSNQASALTSLDFGVRQAVFGQASAVAHFELEGHAFTLEGTLAARESPAADVSGTQDLEFDITLRFSDADGHSVRLEHSARGMVVVDGANAAIAALTVADGNPDPNQVGQPHLGLPGFGRFSAVDAYLGLTMHSMSGDRSTTIGR